MWSIYYRWHWINCSFLVISRLLTDIGYCELHNDLKTNWSVVGPQVRHFHYFRLGLERWSQGLTTISLPYYQKSITICYSSVWLYYFLELNLKLKGYKEKSRDTDFQYFLYTAAQRQLLIYIYTRFYYLKFLIEAKDRISTAKPEEWGIVRWGRR